MMRIWNLDISNRFFPRGGGAFLLKSLPYKCWVEKKLSKA